MKGGRGQRLSGCLEPPCVVEDVCDATTAIRNRSKTTIGSLAASLLATARTMVRRCFFASQPMRRCHSIPSACVTHHGSLQSLRLPTLKRTHGLGMRKLSRLQLLRHLHDSSTSPDAPRFSGTLSLLETDCGRGADRRGIPYPHQPLPPPDPERYKHPQSEAQHPSVTPHIISRSSYLSPWTPPPPPRRAPVSHHPSPLPDTMRTRLSGSPPRQ